MRRLRHHAVPSGGSADEKPCVSAECGQARGVAAAENLLTPAVLCFAVLAQQTPTCKASKAGHKSCVNGETHSKAQQGVGVHGGVCDSNETAGLGQG